MEIGWLPIEVQSSVACHARDLSDIHHYLHFSKCYAEGGAHHRGVYPREEIERLLLALGNLAVSAGFVVSKLVSYELGSETS
jgi:hypothetical protein